MKKTFTFLCLSLIVSFTSLSAQELYGYFRDGGGETTPTVMYQIDPSTGDTMRRIDSTGVGQITAASFDYTDGSLYASHGGGGCCPVTGLTACLMKGDTATAAVSVVGCDTLFGGVDNMPGLAVNSKGEIYGALLWDNADSATGYIHLVTVEKGTGNITVIDTLSDWCTGHGMAFGPGDTLYYFEECTGFCIIDLETAEKDTIVDSLSLSGFPSTSYFSVTDMTWDPKTGIMYASVTDAAVTALATVDLTTGVFTFVGEMGSRINSLAMWNPVPKFAEIDDTLCGEFTVFGGDTLTEAGTYNDTLTAITEVDSFVTLNLVKADFGLEGTDTSLTAKQDDATYQWYNCDADTLVTGETGQTFTTTDAGNYACIITYGPCTDTSGCASLPFVSREDDLFASGFKLYPNPAQDHLNVKFPEGVNSLELSVYNMMGQLISRDMTTEQRLDISGLTPGMYMIVARKEELKAVKKFIKR